MVFQGSLKSVWSLMEVSRLFQGSFKGVSRIFRVHLGVHESPGGPLSHGKVQQRPYTCSMIFSGFRYNVFVKKVEQSLSESLKLQGPFGGPCRSQLRTMNRHGSCRGQLLDLDQTFNKGSWEHIQQITTVTTTFVRATFVLGTFVHISNISAVTGPIWIKL